MSNSLIFATTTSAASVLQNGVLPLVNISRRRGCACSLGSNSILLNAPGYYKITGTVTFTAPVAGTITIQAQKNGVAVPGITASTTITTANTEVRSLAVSGVVRVFCNEGIASLTLVNTGLAINLSNVSLDVEYLG